MKNFIPLFCLISLTLSEPPVGDGYEAARSSQNFQNGHNHDYHNDSPSQNPQRSLSQEYGVPSTSSSRSSLSTEYGVPNTRTTLNSRTQAQKHSPSAGHASFNQRSRTLAARTSAKDSARRDQSQRNSQNEISKNYGLPAAKVFSQEHRATKPSSRSMTSAEPSSSSPTQNYGVPSVDAQKPKATASSFRNAQSSRTSPVARSQIQTDSQIHGFTAPLSRSGNVDRNYDERNFSSGSRSAPSSTNAATSQFLSARNSKPQFDSQTHSAPSQRAFTGTHSAPNARSFSQEQANRANKLTESVQSSQASGRSFPSSSYSPAARSSEPSKQYGVPEQRASTNQGYDYARARALEELQNQEPASYDFAYQIEDQESGGDFGHSETREENRAEGSYFVVLPDGTKHTVDYVADERGFKPRISVEPAAASGGYDDNASDNSRSAQGPY